MLYEIWLISYTPTAALMRQARASQPALVPVDFIPPIRDAWANETIFIPGNIARVDVQESNAADLCGSKASFYEAVAYEG